MDKLYWLATAVAAMSVGIANAQLAQVDNDTMPTIQEDSELLMPITAARLLSS